jgi:hypothetical protein
MQIAALFLNRPEYIHVTINHFPLNGLIVAMAALLIGLLARNRRATTLGLMLVALLALSVWPVIHFGSAAFERISSMSDEAGQAGLNYHAYLAERWAFIYYITSGIAASSAGVGWKWPRTLLPLSILTLVLAAASLTAGIFIADAGGKIRHSEFRAASPRTGSAEEH